MIPARSTGIAAFLALALLAAGAAGVRALRSPDPSLVPQMVRVEGARGKNLWVQTTEVSIAQWQRCHDDGACTLNITPPPFPNAENEAGWPATGLSYVDVSEYLSWINRHASLSLRLPSIDEWEALAAPVIPEEPDPIFTDPSLSWASAYLTESLTDRRLRPSRSWSKTSEGVWDLNGNVWEWTQDCFQKAKGGSDNIQACPAFYVGGEHEAVIPYLVRDPARGGCAVGAPPPHLGMRLVSDHPVS